MTASFPIGLYLIIDYGNNENINFDHNLEFRLRLPLIGSHLVQMDLGYAFIVLWCILLTLFIIAILMSRRNLFKFTDLDNHPNIVRTVIYWFVILVFLSGTINFIQEQIGMFGNTPNFDTLLNFFDVSKAPIIEEIGFRVSLIGLPIFLLHSTKSIRYFLKTLYRPSHIDVQKIHYLLLIIISGILFGLLHVLFNEFWDISKLAQATISGIILGWTYFRYGFIVSVLIHWSINYFVFAYIFLTSYITNLHIQEAISHPFINILEILFMISGIISICILATNYFKQK